jgi:hypothetical protein
LIEKVKFIGPQIGVVAFLVGIVPHMARARRRQRQQICAQRAFVGGAIGAEGRPRLPVRPKPSLCATASWTMRASIRSGCTRTIRKPTGPP